MQSFSYFAIVLFVSVVTVVFGADQSSTPATTVAANETSSTSNTTSTDSMKSISNDDPNAGAETDSPTRKPEMSDMTKKPLLVHGESTVATTMKSTVTVPVATNTMPNSNTNGSTLKGNTSPMSGKKGGSGVSKVSGGLALCSLVALFTIGIFS